MDLQDCVTAHHAAHSERIAASPKGAAYIAVYQLTRALIDLTAEDRSEIVARLTAIVAEHGMMILTV